MKNKVFRVYLVNVQTLGAMCGWGSGRTHAEAVSNALQKARQMDPGAWFESGQVFFRGGVNC
jgi:hypothetical protein